MEAVQIIKDLKKYSFGYNDNEERDLVDINKYVKNGYSYSYVINKINNGYEVYMAILSDEDMELVASNLLYEQFEYLDQARQYFDGLIDKYNNLTIEKLYAKFSN